MKTLIEHEVDFENFNIVGDIETLIESIEDDRRHFEEDTYSLPFSDDYLTEEEYNSNIDTVLSQLHKSLEPSYLKGVIEQFPKKKNGTFKKGQVCEIFICGNSQYWEDSYGYNVDVLRFKSVSDNTLELQYFNTVIGY